MPVHRMRMRPWLEYQIESNSIPGLIWLNKEEMIFQIPWKHAARHGWDIDKDACLFRSWAIHTGRYKNEGKLPDPKTWKANFRCAMNSLPDIQEVKDRSVYKGSSAVRVYKMLPPQIKNEKKERKSKSLRDAKSRLKKKADCLSTEEEIETAVKSQLPGDHSSYTAHVYSNPEMDISSTNLLGLNDGDINNSISEWRNSLEISPADSTNDLYPFQVSPMASSSEEEDEGITLADFCRIFEQTSEWQQTNIDGKGFYTNEAGNQNNYLAEMSMNDQVEEIIKVAGEIEVRFSTDMKNGIDLINWLEPNFTSRSSGLTPMSCAL